jgi:hypothetical protein
MAITTDDKKLAEDVWARWAFRPDYFVLDTVFANAPEGDGPSSQQLEGLQEVGKVAFAKMKSYHIAKGKPIYGDKLSKEEKKYSKKKGLAIRSGHGCGKDAFLSWVYLWLLIVWGPMSCRGQVTAVNQGQLRNILWTEFRRWIKYSAENAKGGKSLLSESITVESDKVYLNQNKAMAFVLAKTANVKAMDEGEQAEALAGAHDEHMILAADEASGLPKGVFKPIEGAMTQAMNFAILIGNPTRYTGYFRECFHEDRGRWVCIHWNAEDSPLQNPDELESDLQKYGYDSNWYRIRRRGEFPLAEPDALIPIDWIEAAVNRDIEPQPTDPLILGVDVARYGNDKSVQAPRQGFKFYDLRTVSKRDTHEVGGWVNETMDELRAAVACVDVIGVGGGVVDFLKHTGRRYIAVDVSRTAVNEQRFYNRRAEYYWKLRTLFEENLISIPDDSELQGELSSIKFKYDIKGRILIESKEDRKRKGLDSPNKAEAVMLSLAANDGSFRRSAGYDDHDDEYERSRPAGPDGWMYI